MTNAYEKELEVGLAAVRIASKICQTVQSGITPAALEKKDRSPVTIADFASQAVVCNAIRAAFPDPIIGEEGADELRTDDGAEFLARVVEAVKSGGGMDSSGETICDWIDEGSAKDYSERFWTLDPIDGTKGFLRGEQYAVALALVVNGKVDVGLVACPNLTDIGGEAGTICVAVRGQGAWTVPLGGGDSTPAKVTTTTDSAQARFCESVESGHSSHDHSAQIAAKLGITADSVRLDSQAKYAVVGRGEADIYLRLPTRPNYREKIWDHAGGVLFCEEAGGTVTDVTGKPLEFTHGFELAVNRGVVVTNGPLHDAVLAAVKEVGIE